jgi:hypothetical protein
MEPIIPITETKSTSSPAHGTLADLIACIMGAAASVIALAYSALFFSRFLENDTHLWGVVSAFLLCFGVGAFGYVPAGITSRIAYKAYKSGANSRGLIFAIILLLPWILLSIALVMVSDMSKFYSLPMFIIVNLLAVWAFISYYNLRRS